MKAEGKREGERVAREGEEAEGRKEKRKQRSTQPGKGRAAEGGGTEGEIEMRRKTLSRERGEKDGDKAEYSGRPGPPLNYFSSPPLPKQKQKSSTQRSSSRTYYDAVMRKAPTQPYGAPQDLGYPLDNSTARLPQHPSVAQHPGRKNQCYHQEDDAIQRMTQVRTLQYPA